MTRIFHTYDRWECFPAGFYAEKHPHRPNDSKERLEQLYASFLSDSTRFKAALGRVITEWKNSCEHYLSNEKMNRIAWLGQAAACIEMGLPSCYRGGFHLLAKEDQDRADAIALGALNEWLAANGEPTLTAETAKSKTEANIY